MTPKEKAKELIEKFYQKSPEVLGTGKAMEYALQCALIAVDEILEVFDGENTFWQQVKTEIEKL